MAQALTSPKYSDDQTRAPRKRLRPADVLVRAATAELLRDENGQNKFENVLDTVARHYGSCPATLAYIARAVASPASSTTATWAAELVGTAIIDFLANDMARQSGFAQLADRALTVQLEPGISTVKIPSRTSPATLVGAWIGEAAAKPVYAGVLTSTTLQSYKLAALSVFTEEMMATSAIEAIVREVLAHDLAALLDTALFDATAASSVRPAGLFNGATSVTASAATPATAAMLADLKALTAAVAGTGNPDANVVFVVNPAQALSINLLAPQPLGDVIVSGYMTAGSVGAIDVGGVAMIVGTPAFAVTSDAALHMDTVPLPLGTPGSPNVVASPMRSMFQEDAVGLRCVLRAGWIKRRAAATALVTGAIW